MTPIERLSRALVDPSDRDGFAGAAADYLLSRLLHHRVLRAEGHPERKAFAVDQRESYFDFAFYGILLYNGLVSRIDQIETDSRGRVESFHVDGIPVGRLVRAFGEDSGAGVSALACLQVPWDGNLMIFVGDDGQDLRDPPNRLRKPAERSIRTTATATIETCFGMVGPLNGITYHTADDSQRVATHVPLNQWVFFPGDSSEIRLGDRVLVPSEAGGHAPDLAVPLTPLGHQSLVSLEFPSDQQSLEGRLVIDTRGCDEHQVRRVLAAVERWSSPETRYQYFDLGAATFRIVESDRDSFQLDFDVDVAAVLAINQLARLLTPLAAQFGRLAIVAS